MDNTKNRRTKWYYCSRYINIAKVWYYTTPHIWIGGKGVIHIEALNILISIKLR